MKINDFVFHAVGQGLFYTGALLNDRYNFVYDCGTEDKQSLLHKRIDDYISRKVHDKNQTTIDFAVISHLHYDHFSGIMYLDKVAPIKKIYLPYMGDDLNLIALVLASAVSTSEEDPTNFQMETNVFGFILNLYSNRDERDVVFVGKEEDIQNEFGVAIKTELAYVDKKTDPFWQFLFFNNPLSSAELRKYAAKLKEYIQIKEICDFKGHIKNAISCRNFKEIKNIYAYVFGSRNINSTSISMLHYPYVPVEEVRIWPCDDNKLGCPWYIFTHCHRLNGIKNEKVSSASLLTGDAEFDAKMLQYIKNILLKGNKDILIVQVPHHGSYDNWHAIELCKINCDRYVIPFGFGNKYKHPSSATIDSLIASNREIYIATQIHALEYEIFTKI